MSSAGYSDVGSPRSPIQYQMEPLEYSNTGVQRDVSQDTQFFTDVQESKDGDTEVWYLNKSYSKALYYW